MSINLNDFKSGNFEKKKKGNKVTQIDTILDFLKSNAKAYNTEEIAKRLKLKINTVRHSLRKLESENEVTHKTPYYAYKK